MKSDHLRTEKLEVSWDLLESFIAAGLQSIAKGKIKDSEEILAIKLDYAGGFVAHDKIIPVEVVLEKGVRVLKFGKGTS